ncbi:hypothetical protein Tco_0039133 [Tanacetum coccineum]
MVAYLEKSTGSAGFHQIIDFINRSHICYALTKKPEVCVSFIKQFWRTAEIVTDENGNVKIHATVDGHNAVPITEENPPMDFQDRRIGVLEADLTKTKKIYSSAYTKLILRVKKAEAQEKGRKAKDIQKSKRKSKKELEQERLSYAEALRLEEQMNEEQRAQIARDAEIARQWEEEEKKKAMDEVESTKKIDWNDPSVIRYHSLKMKPRSIAQARRNMIKYLKNQGNFKINDFKGMSYNEIRPIFEKLWDFNQKFVPMDAEKEKSKSPEKERTTEKIVEEEAGTQEEREISLNEPAPSERSLPRKTTRKRQKLEVETEKEELKTFQIKYQDKKHP